MRKLIGVVGLTAAVVALGGCTGHRPTGLSQLNEFAVTRNAPLVVPPDFALTPPRPGEPRPQEVDSSQQALQAMFGGPAPASPVETAVLGAAGTDPDPGIRSEAGDPKTDVVNKGAVTREIIAAPAGDGREASVSTPQ